jgi:catechol 2,3-dioxygenase-like lactoylglutathione lyase family enzyme
MLGITVANTIHVNGFHHVAIKVSDFDRSVKFYSDTLGFELKHVWGTGEGRGALIDIGKDSFLELFAGGELTGRTEGNWFHIALACTDTRAALEKIREAGCEVTMETKDVTIPSNPPFPIRIAFFKGPDGESVELFQTL